MEVNLRTIGCVAIVAALFVPCADGHTLWRLPPPARWTLDAKHRGPQVPPNTLPETLDALTISAWVKPSVFDRYNEIFRIESGTGRVLFSFLPHHDLEAVP